MFNWRSSTTNLSEIGLPSRSLRAANLPRRMISEFLRAQAGANHKSKRSSRGVRKSGIATPAMIELLEPRSLLSAAPVNLVLNGGFESGATNWNWATSGGAVASYSIDSTVSHSGYSSLKLTNSSAAGANVYGTFYQNISGLTVGNTYYISAWVKGSGVGSSAQIETNPNWATRLTLPSGTYDWTQVQLSFVAAATTVPILFAMDDPTTALWIDDVSVTATNSLIGNGGFEGGTSGWNWLTSGGANASYAIDSSTSHSGGASLKLTDSTAAGANIYGTFYQNITGLTVGNTYYISAWVKGTGVGSVAQIQANPDWSTRLTLPSGTYDWTQVRLSFVAQATTAPVLFAVQDPTSALWIDDVTVVDSPNVITNGSFNQGGVSGWNWITSGGAAASYSLDPTVSHWQGASVKLMNASGYAGNVYGAFTQSIGGLTIGNTYTINAYVKGSGVGTVAQIETNTDWGTRLTLPSGTYDWTLVSLDFVANATSVPVLFAVQDVTTSLWIDDVSIRNKSAVVNANTSNAFGTCSTGSLVEQIGVGWNRIDASWQNVSTTQGTYNWTSLDSTIAEAIARGASPDVVLSYTPAWASSSGSSYSPPTNLSDYGAFVKAAVQRYKNVVHVWEIWNEEQTGFFNGTVGQYVDLLKTGYTAAKLTDPSCTVLLGGLAGPDSSYLSSVYELGGGQYFDAVSAHPYQFGAVSEPGWFTQGITGIRNVMNANGDTFKGIWLTELGWSVNSVTQSQQAENLAQTYVNVLSLKAMGVTQTFWYSAFNRSDEFGLLNSNGTIRSSYSAYQTLVGLLGASTYQGAVSLGTGVNANAFKSTDGTGVLAIWSPTSTSVTLSTNLVGSYPVFRDINGNLLTYTLGANGYQIPSTTSMIYVTNCATSLFSSAVLPTLPSYTPGSSTTPAPLVVWASVVQPTNTARAFMVSGKTNTLQVFVTNQGSVSATGTISLSVAGLTTPASKSYSLAAGAKTTLTFSFSVPSSTTNGSLLTATITGTEKIGTAASVAMKTSTATIRITKKNSIEFAPNASNIEGQYLSDLGTSGGSPSMRFGGYFTYAFDLTGTTNAAVTAVVGANAGGPWTVQASTSPTGTYTTVASGTGWPGSQTINLNAYAGKKVYLRFIDLSGASGTQLTYLSLLSW